MESIQKQGEEEEQEESELLGSAPRIDPGRSSQQQRLSAAPSGNKSFLQPSYNLHFTEEAGSVI